MTDERLRRMGFGPYQNRVRVVLIGRGHPLFIRRAVNVLARGMIVHMIAPHEHLVAHGDGAVILGGLESALFKNHGGVHHPIFAGVPLFISVGVFIVIGITNRRSGDLPLVSHNLSRRQRFGRVNGILNGPRDEPIGSVIFGSAPGREEHPHVVIGVHHVTLVVSVDRIGAASVSEKCFAIIDFPISQSRGAEIGRKSRLSGILLTHE